MSIVWSEEDIERMSEITDEDIQSAAVMWRTNAPEEAKDILDAEAIDE